MGIFFLELNASEIAAKLSTVAGRVYSAANVHMYKFRALSKLRSEACQGVLDELLLLVAV